MKGKRDGLQDLDNCAVPVVKARKKSEFWRAICRKMDLILACASLSGFLGITFCGTRNQDFGGPTTKILVSLTINPITTTTTTTTSSIINPYIPIRQS